jgi:hypothetical protein
MIPARGGAVPDFLDCEIQVMNRGQASLVMEGREYSGQPDLSKELEQQLLETEDVRKYGRDLFAALLPPDSDLRSGYQEALAIARYQGRLLRIHLLVEPTAPPELHQLRWERLYDEKKGIALACSREVLLSRYSGLPEAPAGTIMEKPRLLVALANPADLVKFGLPPIDSERSRKAMEEALAPLAGKIAWEFLPPPITAARLNDRLIGGKFHALHLQAHGLLRKSEGSAVLALEKSNNETDFVGEDFFSPIFEGNRDLRLVTLVACSGGMQSSDDPFSGLGLALVKRGIAAVVAMRQAIGIETAARFVEHFYRNLARGGWVDRAVNAARQQLLLSIRDSDEWSTPILFLRLQDGLLWKPEQVDVLPERGKTVKWTALLQNIEDDMFVPFLGPDVSRGLLLSRDEVAAHWIGAYDGFPLDRRTDFPAVAHFVEIKEGRFFPHGQLPKILAEDLLERENVAQRHEFKDLKLAEVIDRISQRHFDSDPAEPHRILAELPISTYVTTNCDNFMTAALRWKKRGPIRRTCLWREELNEIPASYSDLLGSQKEPLVFHMFGSDEDVRSLVLTEDNYLDFVRAMSNEEMHRMPQLLRTKLTQAMLLFLGYDIRRIDCRVLLRGLVAGLRDVGRGKYAVLQVDQDDDEPRVEELRYYIEECFRGVQIEVYWGTVRSFLSQLQEKRLGRI